LLAAFMVTEVVGGCDFRPGQTRTSPT
jgi:hypothetical protein